MPTISPSRTWGLDLSTDPRKSAAVAVVWDNGRPRVEEVVRPLRPEAIVDLLASSHGWAALDVPFGWPDEFVDFVQSHRTSRQQPLPKAGKPVADRTRHLAHRRTDLRLVDDLKVRPLPAAFDRLGKTATMWSTIEHDLRLRGMQVDRAGLDGRVCETYPAAALEAWGLGKRKQSLDEIERCFPFLVIDEAHRAALTTSDDARDALVCSLVARARALGGTVKPPADTLQAARREGWIHVAKPGDPRALLGPSAEWLDASLHVPTRHDLAEDGPKATFDFFQPDGRQADSLAVFAAMTQRSERSAAETVVNYLKPSAVPASLSREAWALLTR